MKSLLIALLPVVALGCHTNAQSRVGRPPMDRDWRLVQDALHKGGPTVLRRARPWRGLGDAHSGVRTQREQF